jgi:hypothetical protein
MTKKLLIVLFCVIGCISCSERNEEVGTVIIKPLWINVLFDKILSYEKDNVYLLEQVAAINKNLINSQYAAEHNLIYDETVYLENTWNNIKQKTLVKFCNLHVDSIKAIEKTVFDTLYSESGFTIKRKICNECIKYLNISKPFLIDGEIGLQVETISMGPYECSDHYIVRLDTNTLNTERVFYLDLLN